MEGEKAIEPFALNREEADSGPACSRIITLQLVVLAAASKDWLGSNTRTRSHG
jgi:hypothetical protein